MMKDEYVTASDLKAIEQRVNREAQQTMQHLLTLQKRIDELLARIESVDTVTNNVIDKVIRNVHRIETRVKEIEEEDHHKKPAQQSVADFERSQSLNALSQKADSNAKCSSETLRPDPNWAWFDTSKLTELPTLSNLESDISKAFMEWAKNPNRATQFGLDAFKAGVKFGQSKPLPNPTL